MIQDLFANFAKYEKAVTEYAIQCKQRYYDSQCFKSLQKRHKTLRDSVDMIFPKNTGFISKLAMPVVKPRKLLRRAVLSMNFRNDPLITLDPFSGTSKDIAKNMQQVLNLNFEHTRFRDKCFLQMVDDAATYGAYVTLAQFVRGDAKKVWRTVYTPDGASPYTRQYVPASTSKNIYNYPVHILNYFQDPDCHDPDDSPYQGIISREVITNLINDYEQSPGLYIKENIERVIKDATKGVLFDKDFYEREKSVSEFTKNKFDRVKIWFMLPLPGNEDDDTIYYAEMINNMVVRFQDNPLDENIRPLTTGFLRKRFDYWWGNTDSEDVIPHQSFVNLMLNMSADMALKMMDRYILYPKDAIDLSEIMNAPNTNGFVGINRDALFGNSVQNMFAMFQPTDTSYNMREWVWSKVERNSQDMNASTDLSRPYDQGGPTNKTATGAQLMNQRGEALEIDMAEMFGIGLRDLGRKNAIMLQQFLGDQIQLRANAGMPDRVIGKFQILGLFGYKANHSLTKNKALEFQRLHNILTGIENFKGTPDPTWQNVNTAEIVKRYLGTADAGDIEEVYVEQQQQPMTMPGMPGPAGPMPPGPAMPPMQRMAA